MNEHKTQKPKKKKGNPITAVAALVFIALAVALVILTAQYYRLTDRLADQYTPNTKETVFETKGMETGSAPETETELQEEPVSEKDTNRETETRSIQEEALATPETMEENETAHMTSRDPETAAVPRQTETEQESGAGIRQEATVSQALAYQASDLTIAEIPNSLYGKFKNPEDLRTSLFSWLEGNGLLGDFYCTCSYEYEEDGDLFEFTLVFSAFSVRVTYSSGMDQYSFVLI